MFESPNCIHARTVVDPHGRMSRELNFMTFQDDNTDSETQVSERPLGRETVLQRMLWAFPKGCSMSLAGLLQTVRDLVPGL